MSNSLGAQAIRVVVMPNDITLEELQLIASQSRLCCARSMKDILDMRQMCEDTRIVIACSKKLLFRADSMFPEQRKEQR